VVKIVLVNPTVQKAKSS